MKKFSIKSLLVLVLALVLALSLVLVACNKDEEPEPEPQGHTASEYFAKLWELSKSIGNETIADNQNIAVSADLGVELAVKSAKDNSVTKRIAVGFAIDAVLDRHNVRTNKDITDGKFDNANVSKDTALKIKVYDMATGENWATVYYFIGDAGNLYIDFAGQNIVLPFDYANDQLGSWLSKTIFEDQTMVVYDQEMQSGYIYEKVEGKGEYQKYYYVPKTEGAYEKGWHKGTDTKYTDVYYKGKAAIGSILTTLSQKMGADWNLNVLVNDVFSLIYRATQMDLAATIGGVAGALRVPERDIYDANGNLNLEKILTGGNLGKTLFAKVSDPKTDADGVTTYTMPINTTNQLIAGALSTLDPLISKASVLALEFKEKDNAVQSFSVKADLKNLATSANEYPSLTVSINELKFRGVDQNKTSDVVKMETTKDKYSTDVALDFAVALDVDGITIKPSLIDNRNSHFANVADIVLDGQLVVSLKGKLDLKNTTNNGTNAVATISYQAKGETATPLLKASFVGNRLAVTVDQTVTIKTTATTDAGKAIEVPLAETLVNCFGGYVFNGVQSMFYTELGDNDVIAEDSKYEYFTVSLDGEVYKYNKFASVTDAIAAKANGTKVFCSKDGGYNVLNQFANVFFAKDGDNLNYFDINTGFKGAVWDNINIVPLFQKGVNKIVEMLGGNGLVKAGTSAIDTALLTKIANTITKVIPLFTTGTDGITVTVDNVNNVISNIGREFDDNMTEDGNVVSITKWDNGNWITDMAKLLVIAGTTYNTSAVQDKITVSAEDIEMYKNAERERYALAYYNVSEDRIVAARNVYKGKNDDQIRIALASEDFKAYANTAAIKEQGLLKDRNDNRAEAIRYLETKVTDKDIAAAKKQDAYKDKTDAEIKTGLATANYDNMTAAKKDETLLTLSKTEGYTVTLEYVGKTDAELKLDEKLKALLADIDDAILAAKKDGINGITAIRFIGKSDDEIKALVRADKAFMSELLAASATVKINMSGSTGFSLAINAKVADATVGISISVGAHKTTTGEFADLAKDVTAATEGWFFHTFN